MLHHILIQVYTCYMKLRYSLWPNKGALIPSMFRNQFGNKFQRCSFQLCTQKKNPKKRVKREGHRQKAITEKRQRWYTTPTPHSAANKRGMEYKPCGLKLKRGGNGRPLGRRVLGSRSSLKNGWTQASSWQRKSIFNGKYFTAISKWFVYNKQLDQQI